MDIDLPKDFAVWLAAKCAEAGGDAALGRRVKIPRASIGRYKKGQTTSMEYGTLAKFARAFPELRGYDWFPDLGGLLAASPAPAPGAAEGLSDEERRLLQTWRTSPEFRLIAAAFQDGSIASRAEQTRQASAIVAAAQGAEAKKDAKTVAAGVAFVPMLFGLTLSMAGYSAAAATGGCLGLSLLSAFSLLVWCFVRWRLAARRERRGQ